MRILLVTDWNRLRGGAEAYVATLAQGLGAAGHEVALLTSSVGDRGQGRADFVAWGSESPVLQSLVQIANPLALSAVRRAMAEHRPELVIVNMFMHHLSPAILLALRRVPTLLLVTDYKIVCPIGSKLLPDNTPCEVEAGLSCLKNGCTSLPHWLRDRPRYALLKRGLRNVDERVCCGEGPQRELERMGLPSIRLEIPVASPGVDYRRRPASSPLFLFVGRLDREKGVDVLLRSLPGLLHSDPRVRLKIVGRGVEQANLERLARELGVESAVTFTGWLDPDRVEEQLARAWALVAPSLWPEPFGMVAPEALIRGVPVIATDHGGFAATVEDGETGFLVPSGDAGALEVAMQRVIDDELPRTLSDERRQALSRRFSIEEHLGRLTEIIERMTAGRPRSSSPREGTRPT